jgi:hypothetical protein
LEGFASDHRFDDVGVGSHAQVLKIVPPHAVS